jgi:aminoglycoside 6-adenylyltransferase
MLLTSTRAISGAHLDIFSDYDLVLVVADIQPLFTDRSWLEDFGQVLVAYWDPIEPDDQYGIEESGNVIQYADGLKIDFRLWPVELARRIVQAPRLPPGLDAGYTVLLDKDGLTAGMRPPTYRANIPPRPSEEAFLTAINDFFSDAPYVAKCFWRDELLPAKWCLDFDMKHAYLRRMLEWRMECDHGWSMPAGNLGKGLKARLPRQIWSELEETLTGAGPAWTMPGLFMAGPLHWSADVSPLPVACQANVDRQRWARSQAPTFVHNPGYQRNVTGQLALGGA